MRQLELLTHEQTLALIKRAQNGDTDAQEELCLKIDALVKSIVKRFLNRGVEYDDLVQIGRIGLLKSIMGFNAGFGVRFSTYAVPMIAGDIKRFLRDDGMVKVSRSIKENARKAYGAQEELKKTLGRDPTVDELAQKLNMDRSEVVFAMESAVQPASLFEHAYDAGESKTLVLDLIEEKQDVDMVDKILIKELISRLEPKERKLIMLRYFDDKTQAQIAEVMGVSQVQISRQLSKTITKLKQEVCR